MGLQFKEIKTSLVTKVCALLAVAQAFKLICPLSWTLEVLAFGPSQMPPCPPADLQPLLTDDTHTGQQETFLPSGPGAHTAADTIVLQNLARKCFSSKLQAYVFTCSLLVILSIFKFYSLIFLSLTFKCFKNCYF